MRRFHAALLFALVVGASPLGCANTTRNVTGSARYHRLPARPGGRADAHAVTYDSRGRGAYLKVDKLMKLCAEPPPDVAANLQAESSFAAKLNAVAEYAAFKGSLDGSIDRSQSASSTIADAATRTELVLFMRDALYRICEMTFNDTLSKSQARRAFFDVISAGRVLGQRDNVGKLVELAKAMMAAPDPDAALLHDVIGTIRFLAASDYLLANSSEDGGGGDATAQFLLQAVLGAQNIADARRLIESRMKERKEEFTTKQAALPAAKAEEKKKINIELQQLHKQQIEDKTLYEKTFSTSPPNELLFDDPNANGKPK